MQRARPSGGAQLCKCVCARARTRVCERTRACGSTCVCVVSSHVSFFSLKFSLIRLGPPLLWKFSGKHYRMNGECLKSYFLPQVSRTLITLATPAYLPLTRDFHVFPFRCWFCSYLVQAGLVWTHLHLHLVSISLLTFSFNRGLDGDFLNCHPFSPDMCLCAFSARFERLFPEHITPLPL